MTARNNPWLGLKSYEEDDRIYGRNKETEDLTNVIINSFNTTIYGKSGIGKTSLLKAGIFPMLRYEDFCPVYIRLEHDVPATNMLQYYISQIDEAIKRPQNGVVVTVKTEKDIESLDDIFTHYQFETTRRITLTPVFVFDQFEEIFTLNEERSAKSVDIFFKDLSNILNDSIHELNYRIVFCLREDYLYCVERYSETIPAFKRNRYNLKDLSRDEAMEVITMPVQNLVTISVADEILRKIASDNTDEVNATILSLYLSQLYEKMQKAHQTSITSDILHTFGDDIISSFYYENTKGISDKSLSYLEERLVTNGGYRHNIPLEDAFADGVNKKEIEILRDKRILNIQPRHNNILYIEFTHDVLCPIIVEHRADREVHKKSVALKRNISFIAISLLIIFSIVAAFIYTNQRRNVAEIKSVLITKENDSIASLNRSIKAQKDSIENLYKKLENEAYEIRHKNDSINKLQIALRKESKSLLHKEKELEKKNKELLTINEELKAKEDTLKQEYLIFNNQHKEQISALNRNIKTLTKQNDSLAVIIYNIKMNKIESQAKEKDSSVKFGF